MTQTNNPKPSSFGRRLYQTIYNLKVRQVIIVLFGISVVLYILGYVGKLPDAPKFFVFFANAPFPALADACLTSAIVGFTFELLVRNESEAGLLAAFRELMGEQAVVILEGVPRALLLRKDVQKELLKKSKLEEVILTALQSHLTDEAGEGIYNGLIRKAIAYEEFWSNYRYEIFVEDITDKTVSEIIKLEYFDVIMRITYDTYLKKNQFKFTCAANQDQFNDLMRNSDYEVKWMTPPSDEFKTPDETSFQVLQMSVDEIPLTISPLKEPDGRYEVICTHPSLQDKLGQKVTISYTFKVKAEKTGHAISTTVIYPTFDVTIEFNYAKASIDYVEVLDYFVSARKPAIRYIPDVNSPYKITVQLKEWAFPKGGAVFVWTLKEETQLILDGRSKIQSDNKN